MGKVSAEGKFSNYFHKMVSLELMLRRRFLRLTAILGRSSAELTDWRNSDAEDGPGAKKRLLPRTISIYRNLTKGSREFCSISPTSMQQNFSLTQVDS